MGALSPRPAVGCIELVLDIVMRRRVECAKPAIGRYDRNQQLRNTFHGNWVPVCDEHAPYARSHSFSIKPL